MISALVLETPLAGELRRLVDEHLRHAQSEAAVAGDPEARVHEIRRALKKARAVLRLGRAAFGSVRKSESDAIRDVARRLSDHRDATAVLEVFATNAERFATPVEPAALSAFDACLKTRRDDIYTQTESVEAELTGVAAALGGVRDRLAVAEVDGRGFEAVEPGLRSSYRAGRRAARAAARKEDPEVMHAWRKRAKDLRYQLSVIEPVYPEILGAYRQQAHALTDLLGEHQDFDVLATAARSADLRPKDRQRLQQACTRRQAKLRALALPLGKRIYADKPTPWVDRLHTWWTVAAGQAQHG